MSAGSRSGRELDAVKLGLEAGGQFLDGLGLGQTRGAFDQQVSVGEQGNQQALDQFFLAEDLRCKKMSQRDKRFTVIHRYALFNCDHWVRTASGGRQPL